MHYDFIEIGTSDFDTLIEVAQPGQRGLSVEPVSYYYNKLPKKPFVSTYQYAIGERRGDVRIYSTPIEVIEKLKLPDWVRGCNCIGEPHPTVVAYLKHHKVPITHDIFVEEKVPMITLHDLFMHAEVSSCKLLKLDCEGYDSRILLKYWEEITRERWKDRKCPNALPDKIWFENNLTRLDNEPFGKTMIRLQDLFQKYRSIGYEILLEGDNVFLSLPNGSYPSSPQTI